jgi:hypothetical protein
VPERFRSSADGKTVVLLVPKADGANGSLWSAAIDAIAAPALKDGAGNLIGNASISTPYTVSATYDAFTASDVKAYATSKNTIVVESVDSKNLFAANQPAGSFKFDLNNSTAPIDLGVTAAQVSTDGTKVTLTFANSLSADAMNSSDTLELVINASSGIKDQNGTELAAIAADNTTHTVADKIKATQTTTTVGTTAATNDEITIGFDEDVKVATGLTDAVLASGIELKIGTATLIPNVDYTSTISNGDVLVTVLKVGVKTADVSVEVKRPEYLSDLANNGVNVKSAVTERVLPTAVPFATDADSFKVVSATSITVKFSEALDAATFAVASANGFAVAGGTETLTKAELSEDGMTVTLTGTNFSAGTTTVAYTAGTVADKAGNLLASILATATN